MENDMLNKVQKSHSIAQSDPSKFMEAVHWLADGVGGAISTPAGTTISEFKTHYATVLDRAEHGYVEIVTRGNKRFVIIFESQLVELKEHTESKQTVGDLFADLPDLPENVVLPRAVSKAVPDQYSFVE